MFKTKKANVLASSVDIAGIKVKGFNDMSQAVDDIYRNRMESPSSAIAINPEKILTSIKDNELLEIINSSELRYIDGVGVSILASLRLGKKVARIPGCELWEKVMERSATENKSVYLVGSTTETVIQTKSRLESTYNVNVVGYTDGYFKDEVNLINDIKESGADIITVAMGSPKQEKFIEHCKKSGINAFFMGVGGTYDVFTGKVTRAPLLFRRLGLEWLFRLLGQPSRIFRQAKLLKFVFYALMGRL